MKGVGCGGSGRLVRHATHLGATSSAPSRPVTREGERGTRILLDLADRGRLSSSGSSSGARGAPRTRMPPRSLVRGRAGPAAQQAGPPVDPKLEVVAAWLRNEKRSGLYTKEAVQYEKVCRPCLPALRACGLWPALATWHAQHAQASA